jgi:CheY-like chemotaxis protein
MRENPDLLVLDVMMPGLDGLELLRRIRRCPRLAEVPAIIVSAMASSDTRLRMLKLTQTSADTIDAYVSKPFNPATLLKTVKHVLLHHRDYLAEKHRLVEQSWEAQQSIYH